MEAMSRATNSEEQRAETASLDEAQRRFIDDFGQMYARYGLALSFGRVFGLLLVSDEPISLDDIAATLGISKTGASVTTRELERAGVARRLGTRGSRRILYEATDDMDPIFAAMFARIRDSLATLQRAAPTLAEGRAKQRLRSMMALHEFWLRESASIMERWRSRRERP